MTEILAVDDAARLLGCTPENVRKLEQRGVLTCTRTVGGMRLFDAAEVQRVKTLRDARPTKWHPIEGGGMSDTTKIYISLPEDLEPLLDRRGGYRRPEDPEPLVRISRTGVTITSAAMTLIGNPKRITLTFGQQSRMAAIRPTALRGFKVKVNRHGGVQLSIPRGAEILGLPDIKRGHSHQFKARLVEGCLLIGPLPVANRIEA